MDINMRRNIVLIGMPGSGKTTIGKLLSLKLNMSFIDIDSFIESAHGEAIVEIFKKGEDCFRSLETDAVKKVSELNDLIISTGGGIIKKAQNMELLKKNGIVVFIDRPVEEIIKDIDITARPLLSEGSKKLYQLFSERYDLYRKYCDIIVSNTGDAETTADAIIELINS